MKKLNLLHKNIACKIFVCLICSAVAIAFFSACKSTPSVDGAGKKISTIPRLDINPLELLDSGSNFYLSLTPEADKELTGLLIKKYFGGIESQASQIISRISTVYAGFNRSRHSSYLQMTARGDLPQAIAKLALTKKNGFVENLFFNQAEGTDTEGKVHNLKTEYKYYTSDSLENMQMSLPSSKIACIAPDVSNMLARYDNLSLGHEAAGGPNLPADVLEWLTSPGDQIRFFAANPLSFLTILTGTNLNLQLSYVKAIVESDNSDNYTMNLEFEFVDERVVRVGQSILSLAFGLANSNIEQKTKTNLRINGVQIPKTQIYKLLSL